jgi:chitodextrinase
MKKTVAALLLVFAIIGCADVNEQDKDTTAPVLSGGSVSNLVTVAGTTATLQFTSDEAGTYYYVVLGTTTPAPNAGTVKVQGMAAAKGTAAGIAGQNTISVTGLAADTQYTAYIVVEDASGNLSAVLSITGVNPSLPDTTAPTLNEESVSDLVTAAGTTATLQFTSNEAGTYYYMVWGATTPAPNAGTVKAQGTAEAKGTAAGIAGQNTIAVTGLTADTQYTAYIVVEDASGNLSAVLSITGVNPSITPDTTAPVLSGGSVSNLVTATGTTATLKFTSNEAGTYYYLVLGATTPAPNAEAVKAQGTAEAKGTAATIAGQNPIAVTGLTAGTSYTAYIVAEDTAGNLSAVLSITGVNPSLPDTAAPELSAGSVINLVTAAGTTATLKFTSDEAGTYYYLVLGATTPAPNAGTVKAQGTATAKGTAAGIAGQNTISVTGLTVNTQYTAYIVVEDASGNLSMVLSITGVNPSLPDTAAPTLSGGIVSDLATTTATLQFTSNEAGTYYYMVLGATTPAPNAEAVKAQGTAEAKGTAAAIVGQNTIRVTGLTAGTVYRAYIVAEDAAGNSSSVLTIIDVNPVILVLYIGASQTAEAAAGTTLASAITWLVSHAAENGEYTIKLWAGELMSLPRNLTGLNSASGVTITLTTADDTERIITLNTTGALFTLGGSGKTVTLKLDGRITLKGRSNNTAALVQVNTGGVLEMAGNAKITENRYSSGGGVSVFGGDFTMKGGEISGNMAYSSSGISSGGGGVYVGGGTFTMKGGEISKNTAYSSSSSNGGGVYVGGGTFIMEGGEISGNTASGSYSNSSSGGGVFVFGGTFTMKSGEISGNTTDSSSYSNGGGVYVGGSGIFTMGGGEISGNTVNNSSSNSNSSSGGGVYFSNIGGSSEFNKTGGVIYGSSESGTDTNGKPLKNEVTGQTSRGAAIYINSSHRRETTVTREQNLSKTGADYTGQWTD